MQSLLLNIRGVLIATGVLLNSVVLCLVIYFVAIFKFLAPTRPIRDLLSRVLAAIASVWIRNNSFLIHLNGVRYTLDAPEDLDLNGCYLLNCNHQTWVDIPMLQLAFNGRAPFMRFLLKKELIWVPFLGLAWWVMDFPFMRRVSQKQARRNPGLVGKDLETARKACERFERIPVSMMNFLEGTRFTQAKQQQQKSPYQHLLKPRVGGLGQLLYSMGERLKIMIDVTIVYPDGRPTFWDLLSGRIGRVIIKARQVTIPEHLRGRDFRSDRGLRRDLDGWAQELWQAKDALIQEVLADASMAANERK